MLAKLLTPSVSAVDDEKRISSHYAQIQTEVNDGVARLYKRSGYMKHCIALQVVRKEPL